MKTYWWIIDEWGIMHFFDSRENFNHARTHIHGMMEGDTHWRGYFKADNVQDCWETKDVLKWKDGIMKNG